MFSEFGRADAPEPEFVRQRDGIIDALMRASPDRFFLLDLDGTILEYRAREEREPYLPPERCFNKRIQEVLPPEVGALYDRNLPDLLEKGEAYIGYARNLPDGVTHHTARFYLLPERSRILTIIHEDTVEYRLDLARKRERGTLSEQVVAKPSTPSAIRDAQAELALHPGVPSNDLVLTDSEALKMRRNSRILLVEDNVVNQEAAFQMLNAAGMMVAIAGDGQRATQMAAENEYDLILMDIQMPDMDGLEAAKAIRATARGAAVPILAMTSGASEEDRQKCLLAGMNDQITKPVEIEELCRNLIRWLPIRHVLKEDAEAETGRRDAGAADGALSEPDAIRLLRGIADLDVDFGLRSMLGNVRHYARLLRLFLLRHARDGEELRPLLESRDLTGVRKAAHSLKGAAGTLGLVRLQALAGRLEQAAAAQEPEGAVAARAEELFRELERATGELKLALPRIPAPDAPRKTRRDVNPADDPADKLEAMLSRGDADALAFFDQTKADLVRLYGDGAAALEPLIRNSGFQDALSLLRTLLKRG